MQIAHEENCVLLQEGKRLSESLIWQLQRNYFDRQGITAWSTGTVPHHITSSAFIAEAYARVVFGFLRDCCAQHDVTQPVYIVELGAGPGRFAYLFLKKFLSAYSKSVLKDLSFKYVMTDFTERNVEYWRTHKWLQPFIEAGVLDFAEFDVEHDESLRLIHSGEVLSRETLRNPMIAIANYVFDSIPQDAFSIADGQLFETLLTVRTAQADHDLTDPEILTRLETTFRCNPVDENYYDNAHWNRILLDYKQRLPAIDFLFPTAGLECVRNLHRLSNSRLLLLSADRGYSSDDALLQGQGAPGMVWHGSFSMMVDYQIIGEYCRLIGGHALHPRHSHDNLHVCAFMFGNSRDEFVETRSAYDEAIERFGPDDFFTLKDGIETVCEYLTLDHLLTFLRLSGWDYKRFLECLPVLKKHLPGISDAQKQQLHDAILRIWDLYLPIGERTDLAFEMGTLLLEMDFCSTALEFLQHSVDLYGDAPGTAYNMAVCYYNVENSEQAMAHVDRALGLDPDFAEAKTLKIQLESALLTAM